MIAKRIIRAKVTIKHQTMLESLGGDRCCVTHSDGRDERDGRSRAYSRGLAVKTTQGSWAVVKGVRKKWTGWCEFKSVRPDDALVRFAFHGSRSMPPPQTNDIMGHPCLHPLRRLNTRSIHRRNMLYKECSGKNT